MSDKVPAHEMHPLAFASMVSELNKKHEKTYESLRTDVPDTD